MATTIELKQSIAAGQYDAAFRKLYDPCPPFRL